MAVKYRLFYNGNLSIAGKKITTETSWNDNDLVDDTHLLDDAYTFNDTDDFSLFFSYLFGISGTQVPVKRLVIDKYGNLIAPVINESATEPSWNDDLMVDDTRLLDDAHIFNDTDDFSTFFDYFFGSSSQVSMGIHGKLWRVGKDKSISLAGIITEGVTF